MQIHAQPSTVNVFLTVKIIAKRNEEEEAEEEEEEETAAGYHMVQVKRTQLNFNRNCACDREGEKVCVC